MAAFNTIACLLPIVFGHRSVENYKSVLNKRESPSVEPTGFLFILDVKRLVEGIPQTQLHFAIYVIKVYCFYK